MTQFLLGITPEISWLAPVPFFSIILNITFMFASNGKGLPLEANSELGMNQLSAGGGEGNEYQCVFQRPDGDLT